MPNFFHQSKIFRLALILLTIQFIFPAHFSQTSPTPAGGKTTPSPAAASPKPHPETTLDKSPPETPQPAAPVEPDDESLLTMLLSEKSRNLHQWGAVTQFNGLPSDRVNAISQTPDGFLWFGTDLGLARFDGRRVERAAAEIFSNRRILALETDDAGQLWVGTSDGAYYLAGNSFQSVPETAGAPINAIVFDQTGRVYLAAENGFVYLSEQSGNRSRATKIVFAKNVPVKSLAASGANLFVGTHAGGLFLLAGDETKEIVSRPRPFFINALAADSKGKLWLGANSAEGETGLFATENSNELTRAGDKLGAVTALALDKAENVLVATRESGAYLFGGGKELKHFTFENTAGGLRANEVLSVFIDREEVVWFGTTKGVSRFDAHSFAAEQISVENQSNFIRAIFQARSGKIYAGTQRGLFVSETPDNWRAVPGFERRTIYSINEDAGGRLMLGTIRGLSAYPPKTIAPLFKTIDENSAGKSENQTPAGSVRGIQQFQNKIYLAVFEHGLAAFEGGAAPKIVANNYPEIQKATSLKSDDQRKLWIGTAENGAFYFDGSRINAEPALAVLKNRAVWAIEGAETRRLWFGTENGLYLFAGGALETVLENVAVRGIALSSDDNGVWCATDRSGLMRVAHDADFGWITSRLDVEQGLPSQRVFTISKLEGGTLLVGTNRGIVRYQPPQTQPILVATRVLSRRLHAAEELKAPLTLEYPQNTLTLDVSAISSRTFPEQFQYAFLLKNEKGEILRRKFGKDAQFLLENLAPGDYAVEARGFDKNLIASAPLNFRFKVEKAPFPLVTLALTILLLLALIALVWAIYSQKRIFQKSAELRETNLALTSARLDLVNEAERERRRISRDLHDQTLADLRHLQLLADKLPQTGEPEEKAKIFRAEIENVSSEIRRICEDLSPSVLENIGFAAALEWALTNSLGSGDDEKRFQTRFHFAENLDENLTLTPSEQIQIYRIVQEVLSNIARHSSATRVSLNVEKSPVAEFVLQIADDGGGFDFENSHTSQGRGLNNIKSRAELIDAEISFTADESGGTIFTLRK